MLCPCNQEEGIDTVIHHGRVTGGDAAQPHKGQSMSNRLKVLRSKDFNYQQPCQCIGHSSSQLNINKEEVGAQIPGL